MCCSILRAHKSETTHDDFNDNNCDKSFGARIGFTPFARQGLLNFGIGAFFGPEQDDNNSNQRWVIDFDATWSPLTRLLVAGELVYGREANVTMRERGVPMAAPATIQYATWWGLYVLAHYEFVGWLGTSFRYGYFDDQDGGRTGVAQHLQSWTFVPIAHLSRLIPNLRPPGATYPRSRLPIDWVDLKVEYRLNHSNRPVFSNAPPAVDILEANKTSHQVQLQVLLQQNLLQDYVGRDSRGSFALGERFAAAHIDNMPHFYGQIVASLIQRAAILCEVTVLKRPGKV